MYAIIKTKKEESKQYLVKKGDVIDVELLNYDENKKTVEFKDIVLLSDGKEIAIGKPYVENASVEAKILGNIKGKKVIAYKYKRRKNYHKTIGHRQKYTQIEITNITKG